MVLFAFKTIILLFALYKYEYVEGLDPPDRSARIIEGEDVYISDYPFYAGLLQCGGVILSKDWVATAAHCVTEQSYRYLRLISVGGESLSNSKFVSYDRVEVHPQLSLYPPVNDIALLHLTEPLNFTDKIRPVELPSTDLTRGFADSEFVFTGRGLDESGEHSEYLQKMEVRRLSTEECLSNLPDWAQQEVKPNLKELEKAIICAQRVDGGSGLCYGDSGSPLTQGNTLFGIASFILPSHCDEATLGFYVNVANYVPWIKSITGLESTT